MKKTSPPKPDTSDQPFHFSVENASWIGGCVIMLTALIYEILNNWNLMSSPEKYCFSIIPITITYLGGFCLSSLKKMPILKTMIWIVFGILSPISFLFLLRDTLHLSSPLTMVPAFILMIVPAVIFQEKICRLFLFFFGVHTYLLLMPLVFSDSRLPNFTRLEIEFVFLGVFLMILPLILNLTWEKLLRPWTLSLGSFFLLLGLTFNLFSNQHYTLLSALVSFIVILAVLALSMRLKNRIMFIEGLVFYVGHVMHFGTFYFSHSPKLWPVILGISGLTWLTLMGVYKMLSTTAFAHKRRRNG